MTNIYTYNRVTDHFNIDNECSTPSLCAFNGKLYTGTNSAYGSCYPAIYESSDNGLSWDNIKTFIHEDYIGSYIVTIAAFNSELFVGMIDGSIWKYNGTTWIMAATRALNGHFDGNPYSPLSLTVYDGRLYVAIASDEVSPGEWQLCYSSADGTTWVLEKSETDGLAWNACGLRVYNGDLYLIASDGGAGYGSPIYKKSGGVWDSGYFFSDSSWLGNMTVFGGKLYVTAQSLAFDRINIGILDTDTWSVGAYHGTYGSVIFTTSVNICYTSWWGEWTGSDEEGWVFTETNLLYISPDGVDWSYYETYGLYPNPEGHYESVVAPDAAVTIGSRTFLGMNGQGGELANVMYIDDVPLGPTADFTSSIHNVNIVDFTDTSTGSPTSWLWDFGDGHTSTSQNPTHTYDEGTFTVSLTATASGVDDTETKVDYIVISYSIGEPALSDPLSLGFLLCGEPALAEPIIIGSGTGSPALSEPFVMGTGSGEVALSIPLILKSVDFSANVVSGTAPLSVIFTHTNSGTPYDTFFWDFGDGDTSTVANPAHIYLTDGIFTVTLIATSISYGSTSNTKVDYINVATSHADFIGIPLSGPTPLGVQFSNTSTFPAIAFFWDFGDGDISTIAAPLHIYEEPGKYTVTLIASNPLVGTYTTTKVEYVTAEMPVPVPAFSATPIVGFEPSTVSFTNESTGFPSGYLWDFGDGYTSIEENPTHIYVLAGTFIVTLTAYNETAPSGVVSSPVSVMVFPVPDLVADFITGSIVPDVGGVKAYFTDTSKEALSWSWEFGDPTSGALNTSYARNPSHVYVIPGVYQITLTVTHGPFSDSICKSVLVTTDILRYMEIWGTARFVDGTPVVADRVVSVGRDITLTEYECGSSATDTFHSYKTINDSGVTRFLVRGRGHVIGIPDSGFEDGASVYLSIAGRQATIQVNDIVVPWSAPFFMTLPSSPTSSIEVDVVFPLATTTIYPEPGTYEDRVEVSFTSNILPLVIYYTVDGTDPKTSSTRQLYVNPFYVEEGTTAIKYYSHDTLGADEVTREAVYIIHGPLVSSDPVPSDYSTPLMITLMGNRPGTIYYRLNHAGVYGEYLTPILLDAGPTGVRTVFIQAYLIDNYSNVGEIQEFEYKIDLLNPTITHYTLSNEDSVTAHQMITVQVDANSYTNTVTGLLLSTYPDFHDASVRLYQPEVTFVLPAPDGIKTVYAQVIDQLGCVSSVKSRTIELNTEIPAFTVSPNPGAPIGETSYIFTGIKSANSGIYLIVNGGTEMLIVPFSSSTTWEYEVSLVEGINILQFQAGTIVSNRSGIEMRTIDVRPIPQGVTEATTITKSDGTWRIPFVFFDEKTGEEATEDLSPPLKQHHNIKKRQHDFRIRVTSDFGLDPVVTFPTQDLVLTEKVITVRGTATPGSKITLFVERRGKVPA